MLQTNAALKFALTEEINDKKIHTPEGKSATAFFLGSLASESDSESAARRGSWTAGRLPRRPANSVAVGDHRMFDSESAGGTAAALTFTELEVLGCTGAGPSVDRAVAFNWPPGHWQFRRRVPSGRRLGAGPRCGYQESESLGRRGGGRGRRLSCIMTESIVILRLSAPARGPGRGPARPVL